MKDLVATDNHHNGPEHNLNEFKRLLKEAIKDKMKAREVEESKYLVDFTDSNSSTSQFESDSVTSYSNSNSSEEDENDFFIEKTKLSL